MENFTPGKELLWRYVRNECTPDEAEAVLQWLAGQDPERLTVFNQLIAEEELDSFPEEALQAVLQKNEGAIMRRIDDREGEARIRKFNWLKLSVAAAVFICLFAAGYIWLQRGSDNQVIVETGSKKRSNKTIEPGGDKAVLTLADGKTVVLDAADNGSVAQEGNTKIIKLNGQLAYQQSGNTKKISYNTITTPRGGQYKLILADGTKVWLNASSSLRFPVSFTGEMRTVELSGEGYFEVASIDMQKKKGKVPFIVKILHAAGNTGEVEVLGTHFNIMAYTNEGPVKTTLLEGSVKVKNSKNNMLLQPGQQASLQQDALLVSDNVDVEEVIAWKDGYFQFNRKAPIEQVMRQVERWYDVEIVYEGAVPNRRFGGKIARDSRLQDVLKMLELNNIRFKIQGRKITVTP